VSVISVLMSALALGALSCLISLWTSISFNWLAFPGGIALAQLIRAQQLENYRWSPLLMVIGLLLMYLYGQYLQQVLRIASLLGISFKIALQNITPGMAIDLIRTDFRFFNLLWISIVTSITIVWIKYKKI